jgi:hypothetical protein
MPLKYTSDCAIHSSKLLYCDDFLFYGELSEATLRQTLVDLRDDFLEQIEVLLVLGAELLLGAVSL